MLFPADPADQSQDEWERWALASPTAVASTRATWKLASHWRVGSLCLFQVQRQADTAVEPP
jgi:hypothetical protein